MEKKILIVDNEIAIRELLYDVLTKAGFSVMTATGGREAFDIYKDKRPDLVLLDIKMPETNGLQVLKEIRKLDTSAKVIMLTGLGSDALEREARLAGASGFLRKNLGIDIIVTAINDIFGAQEIATKDKIMVVDDDPGIRTLVKDFLTKKGYDAVTAESGEEAVNKVQTERPILILLDVNLPGMDGLVTLKRIREVNKDVGVIMITGVKNQDVFEQAKQYGAYEYIVKPFDLNYLETCVMVRICLASALAT